MVGNDTPTVLERLLVALFLSALLVFCFTCIAGCCIEVICVSPDESAPVMCVSDCVGTSGAGSRTRGTVSRLTTGVSPKMEGRHSPTMSVNSGAQKSKSWKLCAVASLCRDKGSGGATRASLSAFFSSSAFFASSPSASFSISWVSASRSESARA